MLRVRDVVEQNAKSACKISILIGNRIRYNTSKVSTCYRYRCPLGLRLKEDAKLLNVYKWVDPRAMEIINPELMKPQFKQCSHDKCQDNSVWNTGCLQRGNWESDDRDNGYAKRHIEKCLDVEGSTADRCCELAECPVNHGFALDDGGSDVRIDVKLDSWDAPPTATRIRECENQCMDLDERNAAVGGPKVQACEWRYSLHGKNCVENDGAACKDAGTVDSGPGCYAITQISVGMAQEHNAVCDENMGIRPYGQGYRGCQTKTRSGFDCQQWTVETPHIHQWTPALTYVPVKRADIEDTRCAGLAAVVDFEEQYLFFELTRRQGATQNSKNMDLPSYVKQIATPGCTGGTDVIDDCALGHATVKQYAALHEWKKEYCSSIIRGGGVCTWQDNVQWYSFTAAQTSLNCPGALFVLVTMGKEAMGDLQNAPWNDGWDVNDLPAAVVKTNGFLVLRQTGGKYDVHLEDQTLIEQVIVSPQITGHENSAKGRQTYLKMEVKFSSKIQNTNQQLLYRFEEAPNKGGF